MLPPRQKLKVVMCSVAFLGLTSSSAAEVDQTRLWLPSNYARLFLDLKQAAAVSQGLEKCATVLSGTIDLEQSTAERPIYRILCRQINGKSYNQLVDGETLMPILPEGEKEEGPEVRISRLWDMCEKRLHEKVRLMKDVHWVSTLPPRPKVSEKNAVQFDIDFDAKDTKGISLHYTGRCLFSPDDRLSVRIFARKSRKPLQ